MICILDKNYFRYYGRVLEKDGASYLGFTNSMVEFYVKGTNDKINVISANIGTNPNGEENETRLKVFIDDSDVPAALLVLHEESAHYTLASFEDNEVHKISIIKITEAAMSHAKLIGVNVTNGEIVPLPLSEDNRTKVEFIGDSITCGYGVYGDPDSEYHIKNEDGMVSYAALTAKSLGLNARYFSVSGFGVYVRYDGDPEGIITKVYPYTNYFVDETIKYNFNDFVPDLVVINLGTNDSGHLEKENIQNGFISNYVGLIKFIKSYAPDSKILCICGTLCTNAFTYIDSAIKLATKAGLTDLYTFELPYHDVERDGMASGHPSLITHQKDAELLAAKIKVIMSL